MANETEGSGANADVEPAKRKVAEHYLIDANGVKVEDEENASGIGYKLLAVDEAFEYQIPGASPASPQTMLAIFGAKTVATNETSQARNNPKGAASATEQLAAVKERFQLIGTGTWIDRTREGVGAKVDIPTLAQAWVNVVTAAGGQTKYDPPTLIEKMTDKPDLVKSLRKDPKVTAEYAKLRGATVVDAGELMAGI